MLLSSHPQCCEHAYSCMEVFMHIINYSSFIHSCLFAVLLSVSPLSSSACMKEACDRICKHVIHTDNELLDMQFHGDP